MKIVAILHTADYRGDHSADVTRVYRVKDGETVEQLCERIFPEPFGGGRHEKSFDKVELKWVTD